jgi:hypothetical protein
MENIHAQPVMGRENTPLLKKKNRETQLNLSNNIRILAPNKGHHSEQKYFWSKRMHFLRFFVICWLTNGYKKYICNRTIYIKRICQRYRFAVPKVSFRRAKGYV